MKVKRLTLIKDRFEGKYRIERDECGDYQIPLRGDRGHIFAFAEDELAVEISYTQRPIASFKAIKARCPDAEIHVCGDTEIIIRCPLIDWEEFLKACRAKTKRQMTDEQKEKASARLDAFKFTAQHR